jgi:hypothetical protein
MLLAMHCFKWRSLQSADSQNKSHRGSYFRLTVVGKNGRGFLALVTCQNNLRRWFNFSISPAFSCSGVTEWLMNRYFASVFCIAAFDQMEYPVKFHTVGKSLCVSQLLSLLLIIHFFVLDVKLLWMQMYCGIGNILCKNNSSSRHYMLWVIGIVIKEIIQIYKEMSK